MVQENARCSKILPERRYGANKGQFNDWGRDFGEGGGIEWIIVVGRTGNLLSMVPAMLHMTYCCQLIGGHITDIQIGKHSHRRHRR